ncbi:MAG: hypothetical protein JNM69_29020 [Archangium sp.]|nr:hypothetical protein [Archangium sp.]
MSQTLFERARALHATGQSAESIRDTLVADGFAAEDVAVILGSVGAGIQPRPDPSADTVPLTVMSRISRSRALFGMLFLLTLSMCAALLWLFTSLFRGHH